MKKLLMAAVALTAMTATPAIASDTSDYTVQGTVAAQCGGLSASGGTIEFGTSITPAADGSVSVASPTSAPAAVTIYCNTGVGTVAFSGSTITRTGGSETLSYTPVLKLNGGAALATGASVGSGGSLLVTASNLTSGGAVAKAGAYTGTLTVTLSPS